MASKPKLKTKEGTEVIEMVFLILAQVDVQEEPVNQKCLLLADASPACAPGYLRQLLQACNAPKLTKQDLFFLLTYAAALEMGFVAKHVFEEHESEVTAISPASVYDARNVNFLSRQSVNYVKTEDANRVDVDMTSCYELNSKQRHLLESKLVCITTGDWVLITLTPMSNAKTRGFSACVPISDYVLESLPRGKAIVHRLRRLPQLSLKLRDEVFTPFRNQQMALGGVYLYPGLGGLPEELYEDIIKHLPKRDFLNLALVNQPLARAVSHSKIVRTKKGNTKCNEYLIDV